MVLVVGKFLKPERASALGLQQRGRHRPFGDSPWRLARREGHQLVLGAIAVAQMAGRAAEAEGVVMLRVAYWPAAHAVAEFREANRARAGQSHPFGAGRLRAYEARSGVLSLDQDVLENRPSDRVIVFG